ncbi:hypothetical protein HanIR_Chr07g0321851 [Helianthus annuus]|nr:hypothetical protein HanIR_Chr07g0321851 [Helianthus annuus]
MEHSLCTAKRMERQTENLNRNLRFCFVSYSSYNKAAHMFDVGKILVVFFL